MKINVPLRRKDTEIETSPCVVEKTIELGADEYKTFSQNLLENYDFIFENSDCMYTRDGVLHCLLVLGKDQNDGILVESEGSAYARYSAFVPNARKMYLLERYPALRDFNDRMLRNVEIYAQQAIENQEEGVCHLSLENIRWDLQPEVFETQLLSDMLEDRPEFEGVEEEDEEIILQLKPEYVPAEEKKRLRISQEDADIMCAKHTLWLYDEGGEQADFSNCELADLNLSHRQLNNALFRNALICNTDFDDAELCFADFSGAEMYDCSLKYISAEESVFRKAKIESCSIQEAILTHSDFIESEIRTTNMSRARLDNACVAKIVLDDITEAQVDMSRCCHDEQDWSEPADPVLSM